MRILVRLPNWLGDMVMSAAFLQAVQDSFAGDEVSVIVKKGLEGLLPLFPQPVNPIVFNKKENSGIRGAWRFGKALRGKGGFDHFFCLPDSLSSAVMGAATGAPARVGYKAQGRNFLLTNAFNKPQGLHRVEEYLTLLEEYTGHRAALKEVLLKHRVKRADHLVVNINSEAQSRRLTVQKAVEVLTAAQRSFAGQIHLIGAPGEVAFVTAVVAALPNKNRVDSLAGKTTLPQLAEVLASARALLTTDSGPAHLANALGTPTVVLFGAGAEANTAPYNKAHSQTIRLGQLPCEPCLKNKCLRFDTPQCLERLNVTEIMLTLQQLLQPA